jgi:hypothetical protein
LKKFVAFAALAVFLLVAPVSLFAQVPQPSWFGGWFNLQGCKHPWSVHFYGGVDWNGVYQGSGKKTGGFNQGKDGRGFLFACGTRYQVFNWLGIQLDASFITKNDASIKASGGAPQTSGIVRNTFLEFPLLLNFAMPLYYSGETTRLKLYASTGAWLGVWLSSWNNVSPDGLGGNSGKNQFDKSKDNRLDAGYIAGTGLEFDFGVLGIFVECRYNYSFTNFQKKNATEPNPKKNNTWTFFVGLNFRPGLSKEDNDGY